MMTCAVGHTLPVDIHRKWADQDSIRKYYKPEKPDISLYLFFCTSSAESLQPFHGMWNRKCLVTAGGMLPDELNRSQRSVTQRDAAEKPSPLS